MSKQPNFPFDLTGYTCFSLANCPVDQCVPLVREYGDIYKEKDEQEFKFRIAALPDAPEWTVVVWPEPGQFYDLMNLTAWLRGYSDSMGAELVLFAALPSVERTDEGPLLARPDYDIPTGDVMLGTFQQWSFDYLLPPDVIRWIGFQFFPMEYFFYGRGYCSTGFQLEWLKHLDQVPSWTECSIQIMEPPAKKGI